MRTPPHLVLGTALAIAGLFLFAARPCIAQAMPAAVSTGSATHASEPHISPVMGFNFSLDDTGSHNSATGWSNVVTPSLSFRFNQHFLLDANVPWYTTLNAFVATGSGSNITYPLKSATNLLGDAAVSGIFELPHHDLHYLATATGAFPTGDVRYGLSANTETYNVTNHVDYQLGPFDPDIEAGFGDNSSLANPTVRKAYVAVGPMANFQAGISTDLPLDLNLDLEAYEDLPIGNQNVYGTITRKAKNGKTKTVQVLEGTGVAEDNGFNAELDLPLGRHFNLAGIYERSLRQQLDTASVGLTWTLRAPKL